MSDSPALHVPIEPNEQPILDRLLMLRDELALMKQDRSTYVKSSDVVQIYTQVVDQVRDINTVRAREQKPLEQNRLDYVLDDCFQLISLFFMACGKNDEIPALYAESSTLKRLLDHLREAAFYSGRDLEGLHHRIDDMVTKLRTGKCEGPECGIMTELLEHRLEACAEILLELEGFLATLDPALLPTWEKLVAILRAFSACNTRSSFPKDEVQGLKEELETIQSQMVNDKFVAPDGSIPASQDIAIGLMRRCQLWSGLVEQKKGKIDERFKETWDKLKAIRDKLEKLSLTQAWSLRETDLWQFQRALDRVDEQRVDGNFIDAEGQPADLHSQRVCEENCSTPIELELTWIADTSLPSSQILFTHIPSHNLVRARLGSSATNIQPAANDQTMSPGSAKSRRC